MSKFMILVTGANGYVGVHLIEKLCREGRFVRALVRRGCCNDEKLFLEKMGAEVTEADMEDKAALMRALEGVRVVVHLLGSIERPVRGGYRGMHTGKTHALVQAFQATLPSSRQQGLTADPHARGKIIYLSALGAAANAGNLYQRTKWEAEEEIRRSGLDYVIVRASLIFGRETGSRDSKLVRKLLKLAVSGRVVPLIGSGGNRLQPIYIADLVSCLERAIFLRAGAEEIWDVGGPNVLTLRRIVDILLKAVGLERRIVSIPYPLALMIGFGAKLAGREGKINLEQVRMSRQDNVCDDNRAEEFLGDAMVDFETGIVKTAGRFGLAAISGKTV